ncbi:MAG: TolC family protein [Steroidobacteraceae bacterium]|nr:TolC family protein [Steroidobacteraceae bacterium]MDW8259157.1 TolC family protein [Gammaproteobacteria bacterium]
MIKTGRLLVAGAMFMIGGCALLPPDRLANDVRQIVRSQSSSDPQWRRGAVTDAARARARALAADGVTIDDAVEIALLLNPDVQLEFEQLGFESAAALATAAPRGLDVEWAELGVRGGPGSKTEFAVLWSIADLLASPARRSAARRRLDAARYATAERLLDFIAEVRKAWLDAVAAEQRQRLSAQRADLGRLAAELAQRYREAGNLSVAEAARHRLVWGERQSEAAAAAAQRDAARLRLARLMAFDELDDRWEYSGGVPQLPATEPDAVELETAALSNRLDVAASRKLVEAYAIERRRAPLLGALSAPKAGYSRERESNGADLRGWSVQFELPLVTTAQLAAAQRDANARRALRAAEATALDARAAVRAARQNLERARAAVILWRDLRLPATRTIAAAEQRHLFYMLVGPFDAMDARAAALQAEAELIGAMRDYWHARLDLARAAALPLQAVHDSGTAASAGEER